MPSKFGTEGQERLDRRYRELYWQVNELQIIATKETLELAARYQRTMERIVRTLGYTPEA